MKAARWNQQRQAEPYSGDNWLCQSVLDGMNGWAVDGEYENTNRYGKRGVMISGIYIEVKLLKHLKIVKSTGEELKETNTLMTCFWWVKPWRK